jgi:PAS domain-containing protein
MMTQETITTFVAVLGTVGTFVIFVWRVFRKLNTFVNSHDDMRDTLETIKSEVTPNGGCSLKDVVTGLKTTCENIEDQQRVADQRSKAALHYHVDALFEIDEDGHLIWSNERFQGITQESGDIHDGRDWISIIHDDERSNFLKEFNSCLEMCRKIDVDTVGTNGSGLRFIGFPYKLSTTSHKGFLVHCFYHDLNLKKE